MGGEFRVGETHDGRGGKNRKIMERDDREGKG